MFVDDTYPLPCPTCKCLAGYPVGVSTVKTPPSVDVRMTCRDCGGSWVIRHLQDLAWTRPRSRPKHIVRSPTRQSLPLRKPPRLPLRDEMFRLMRRTRELQRSPGAVGRRAQQDRWCELSDHVHELRAFSKRLRRHRHELSTIPAPISSAICAWFGTPRGA